MMLAMDRPLQDDTASSPSSQRFFSVPRLALGLLLLINLFNYIDRYILAAVLPNIGDAMLLGDPHADQKKGWLATAFLMAYMFASPLFGYLADRFSRWLLVGAGVALWSLASGASGLAQGFVILLVTRMFVGIGEAAYGPAAPTIISDLYPVRSRGKVLAWFYMAIPVGSALGYALGGAMAKFGHWRWAFYSVLPPGILLAVLCILMPHPHRGSADGLKEGQPRARLSDYCALLKNRSYLLNCLGMAALAFSIGGISHWMPSYVYEYRLHKAVDQGRVNMIFGAITVITGITATLLGGLVGDALRHKLRGAYLSVSAMGLLAAFPFFLAMLFVPFPWAWVFVFVAEFFLFFNTGPSNTALANVTHPAVRSTGFALNILVIHSLGDAISPPIIGALTDRYHGDMNIGFGVVGAVLLVGAFFWIWGSRYLDRDTELAVRPPGESALPGFPVIDPGPSH